MTQISKLLIESVWIKSFVVVLLYVKLGRYKKIGWQQSFDITFPLLLFAFGIL